MDNEKVDCKVCTKCGQVIEANGVKLTHYGCSLMNTDDLGRPMENQEWYQEYMGDIADELSSHYAELLREALKKIVAEAERRGREAAWEQVADVWGTKVLEDAIYLIRANRR